MASPRRAALAALLLAAPAAAQTLPNNWGMEGGSAARYNSIRYVQNQRPDARNRASVFELYLGDSDMVGHDLYAHATPVTTTNRLVIISDVNCNVLALPLPEDLPQQLTPDRAVWAPLWTYTDAASDPALPNRECTSAVADGSRVYWLSRQKRQVFGIETALGAPERLQWSPATLPLDYFSPDAFADHGTGLILRNYSLWIPTKKTAAPGFMSFDVRSGAHSGAWVLRAELRTPQTPLPNLYLTGQDIATDGVTGAVLSGLLTAGAIDKRVWLATAGSVVAGALQAITA